MKTILVAIDFKENEHLLLEKAYLLAKKFESKIWLIHISAPDPDFVGMDVGPQYIRDNRASNLRDEHQKLQAYADDLNQKGVVSDGLMVQGMTTESIMEEAKKLRVDLIITGYQEHSFFYKALYGSVTSALIKASHIPIMVVPID